MTAYYFEPRMARKRLVLHIPPHTPFLGSTNVGAFHQAWIGSTFLPTAGPQGCYERVIQDCACS
jgi:hypothetical protein